MPAPDILAGTLGTGGNFNPLFLRVALSAEVTFTRGIPEPTLFPPVAKKGKRPVQHDPGECQRNDDQEKI